MNGLHWGDDCIVRSDASQSRWRRPHVTAMIRCIKEMRGGRPRVPSVIPMPEAGISDDPLCAYSVLHMLYQRDAAHLSPAERSVTPVFRHSNGAAWTTSDVQDAVRDAATALGLDSKEFAGKSLRIGGATDWSADRGEAGALIVKQRGRWDSDVATIYQRPLLADQLAASASVGSVQGSDLKQICISFAQRAVR